MLLLKRLSNKAHDEIFSSFDVILRIILAFKIFLDGRNANDPFTLC